MSRSVTWIVYAPAGKERAQFTLSPGIELKRFDVILTPLNVISLLSNVIMTISYDKLGDYDNLGTISKEVI